MSQHSELEDWAASRYNTLKRRFRARYTKGGQCYRPQLELPFTLAQFTTWLRGILRSNGVTLCIYCRWPISLETMQLDHRIPISQGGSLELFNLAPACCECNQQKGQLTEGAFLELRDLINNHPKFQGITTYKFTAHDAIDIKARLQSQLKLARWKQARIKAQTVRVVPHHREVV